jgi:hypothetical protein
MRPRYVSRRSSEIFAVARSSTTVPSAGVRQSRKRMCSSENPSGWSVVQVAAWWRPLR